MRKMLLAVVAALSIASAANAGARVDPLPDAMIGSWCPAYEEMDGHGAPLVYNRRSLTHGACDDGNSVANVTKRT